ncbi:MAG: hypothetical protein IKP60_01210 [Treponema sp.]|nr:hypothetical protein [Treponema sp.]
MKAKLCLKNLFIVSTLILIAFAASSCTVNADPPVYYTIKAADGISNGTVTADKTTAKKDETVTLTLTAADGYGIGTISVKDASNNDIATTEVVSGSEYTFVMPESNVTVSVVFKKVYTITVSDEIANGIVTADKTTAKSDETVTLTLTAADDYEIDTISVKDASNNDIATTTVTAGETYTFVMPEGNVTVNAVFKKIYTITVSDGISNGTVTADRTRAKKGATVTLIPIPDISYRFDSISVKDASNNDIATTEVASGREYTFVMPERNVTVIVKFDYIFNEAMMALRAGTDGTAGTSGTYVLFGDWPQTVKAYSVTVDESQSVTMGANTYYKGSDGAWYAKCTEKACDSGYKYSDGTDVARKSANSTKYFKVEPIKWRVLTNDYNGKKLLLAENILAAHRYAGSSNNYSNNYKNSDIREWLNGTFLGAAFTSTAQSRIADTTVDNSARSTNPNANPTLWNWGYNDYACENTSDKIFLLSEQETTKSDYRFAAYYVYKGDSNGTTESTRIRMTTDFAKASGADQSTTAGCGGWWWLRSPCSDDDRDARGVTHSGGAFLYSGVRDNDGGVVPALSLN